MVFFKLIFKNTINEWIEIGDHNSDINKKIIYVFFQFCGVVQNHP
jgi:hypothetical protein